MDFPWVSDPTRKHMRQSMAYESHSWRTPAMRLTRVYVDADLHSGGSVELARETASHLAKVLRARSGDEVILFNGHGHEFRGVIDAVRGARVSIAVGAARAVERESPLRITLIQCVPRGDRMDFVVQKATELGVACIMPVLSQRSVVKLDSTQAAAKRLHWQAVAISACEQCGRNRLPRLEPAQPLLNFLGALQPAQAGSMRLVLEPDAEAPANPLARSGLPTQDVEFAIGPEGGFAPEEIEAFELTGFTRIGLGPRILRTETAAIAALVMLQTRFGDMSALW
jgi:16S rRNA (uracil1498-N3)-methyltransferase